MQGKTAARHTSREFAAFLEQLVGGVELEREAHITCDNLSAHKTQLVDAFLERHPQVRLHFTPAYSSWLNRVELWFSKLQRDIIARGVLTSTADIM